MKVKARKFVEVSYNPDLRNWDKAIQQELRRRGLERGKVTVICRPFKRVKSEVGDGSRQIDKSNLLKKDAQVSAPSGRV